MSITILSKNENVIKTVLQKSRTHQDQQEPQDAGERTKDTSEETPHFNRNDVKDDSRQKDKNALIVRRGNIAKSHPCRLGACMVRRVEMESMFCSDEEDFGPQDGVNLSQLQPRPQQKYRDNHVTITPARDRFLSMFVDMCKGLDARSQLHIHRV